MYLFFYHSYNVLWAGVSIKYSLTFCTCAGGASAIAYCKFFSGFKISGLRKEIYLCPGGCPTVGLISPPLHSSAG